MYLMHGSKPMKCNSWDWTHHRFRRQFLEWPGQVASHELDHGTKAVLDWEDHVAGILVIFKIFLKGWWTANPDRLPSEPDLEARMNGTWWRLLKIMKVDICVPYIQNVHMCVYIHIIVWNSRVQTRLTCMLMWACFLAFSSETKLLEKWVLCGNRTPRRTSGFHIQL